MRTASLLVLCIPLNMAYAELFSFKQIEEYCPAIPEQSASYQLSSGLGLYNTYDTRVLLSTTPLSSWQQCFAADSTPFYETPLSQALNLLAIEVDTPMAVLYTINSHHTNADTTLAYALSASYDKSYSAFYNE